MLPPRPGKDEADVDDEEELTAVMKRLQDAKPPPAVLKVPALHVCTRCRFLRWCSSQLHSNSDCPDQHASEVAASDEGVVCS